MEGHIFAYSADRATYDGSHCDIGASETSVAG
jgi:hypothetical protein